MSDGKKNSNCMCEEFSPPDAAAASKDEKQMSTAETIEYPTGFRLASIILALIMGIFLASLDMVSHRAG